MPIGLTLEDEATAPSAHLSIEQAIARRDELRIDEPPPGIQAGERAWFFRAYDDDELVFLEGSYHPYNDPRPMKRAGRYHIDRRVIVPRSERALDALGVRAEVEMREQGVCGIRIGMSAIEVRERLGNPTQVMYPQAAGCVSEDYASVHVYLCQDAVRNATAERCP
ncbi:MAG TPA: hypothetical protein VL326_16225 [Kofleriaceae bacterium]|nr:hypothetical protein [Kofleriaceae bacterium]